ncbi:MAG: hypothetical protein ACRERC_07730 [Candidatus Binatia bacterium]
MQIICANHSSFPALPSPTDLADVLRAQDAAGMDVVTDGQLGWSDPVAPLLGRLDGVRFGAVRTLPGGLGRGPQPIVSGKLRRHHPLCVAAYQRAAAATRAPVKTVMTGPYTLAHAAAIATTAYRGAAALARDLAAILAQEVEALVAAGARVIQIDEPSILGAPHDIRLLRELLEPLADATGGGAELIIATYGADAVPLYAQLNTLPGDVIAIDCVSDPRLIDIVAETGSGKPLALGLAGAPVAEAAAIARQLERALARYVHPRIYLQPAYGLAALAPPAARARLDALANARTAVQAAR